MKKRLLAMFLTVAMLIGLLPTTAFTLDLSSEEPPVPTYSAAYAADVAVDGALQEVAGIGDLTHGFGQVDDGDTALDSVHIIFHPGVPAAGLVSEMTTGFHKIVNRDFTHFALPFLRCSGLFYTFFSPPGCLVVNEFLLSDI